MPDQTHNNLTDPEITYTNPGRTRAIGPVHVMVPDARIIVRAPDGSLEERTIATVSAPAIGRRSGPWYGRPYRTGELFPVDYQPPAPNTILRRGTAASWNIPRG